MLQAFVADSAIDLYAARLMVLYAAWRVEEGLDHRQEIAMLKTFVAEAFGRILDRAVQVHGGAGITHDLPIAQWYADARAARIYDGSSEVHRMAIAKRLLRLAEAGESTRPACGNLMPTEIAPGDIVRRHEDAPSGRAPLLVVDPLLEFLDRHGLGCGEPAIEPLGDGHSNYTYTLAREGSTVVLRRPPRPPYPKSAHDVLREARLLRAMARTDVPVPNVLAICEDPSIIGVPFYVMERLDGLVYTDRTPPQLDAPDERRRVAGELVDALVKLHAVDWKAAGLQDFGRPAGYLERQLRRFADLLEMYRSREIPALDRLTVWLRDNRPEASEVAIVHGDFRLGNVMFGARAPARLIAIFDWEMATLGIRSRISGTCAACGRTRGIRMACSSSREPPRSPVTRRATISCRGTPTSQDARFGTSAGSWPSRCGSSA